MKNLQRYLYDVANARRKELLPYIFQATGGRVQTGSFRDQVLIPRYMWGDGDTAAKLLGVYEDELHEFIEQAICGMPDTVINIGCAEGYYAVGMAKRLADVPVTAVDVDSRAAAIVRDTARANTIVNIETETHYVNADWIQAKCEPFNRPLLILDCEGAEIDLLDPAIATVLTRCTMLIECHDCVIPGITAELISRFETTHDIQQVTQRAKDPYQFEFLACLSDCDKWTLVHEGRPSTMHWLYLSPK